MPQRIEYIVVLFCGTSPYEPPDIIRSLVYGRASTIAIFELIFFFFEMWNLRLLIRNICNKKSAVEFHIDYLGFLKFSRYKSDSSISA